MSRLVPSKEAPKVEFSAIFERSKLIDHLSDFDNSNCFPITCVYIALYTYPRCKPNHNRHHGSMYVTRFEILTKANQTGQQYGHHNYHKTYQEPH